MSYCRNINQYIDEAKKIKSFEIGDVIFWVVDPINHTYGAKSWGVNKCIIIGKELDYHEKYVSPGTFDIIPKRFKYKIFNTRTAEEILLAEPATPEIAVNYYTCVQGVFCTTKKEAVYVFKTMVLNYFNKWICPRGEWTFAKINKTGYYNGTPFFRKDFQAPN